MAALSVSDVARRLGANPRDVSNLFYTRQLGDDLAPVVAGRRIVDERLLPAIAHALRRSGKRVAPDAAVV